MSGVHRRRTRRLLALSACSCPVRTVNAVIWLTSARVSPSPDAVTDRLSIMSTVNGESTAHHDTRTRRIDSVAVLRSTRHKIGHFGDVSPSQSLGPDPLKENVSL